MLIKVDGYPGTGHIEMFGEYYTYCTVGLGTTGERFVRGKVIDMVLRNIVV
jgi:hypothetical protein